MNLTDLLSRPEGKTLEFKQDLSSPEGFLRSVVAFANTAGGTILIGVEDGSRAVCGISKALSLEERAASLITDSVSPRLLPDLELLNYRDAQVLAIQIYPSAMRPHFLQRIGPEAGTFVRVGSTNRRADADLVAEMRRFAHGESFDEQPMLDLSADDIDFEAASAAFVGVRKLRGSDLETLRLVVAHGAQTVPTIGGVLMFGRDRLVHFPDAWIQAGRFEGSDKARIIDQLDLKVSLLKGIVAAIGFIEKHLNHAIEIGPLKRTARWSLPPSAIREALINAVVHADYSQHGAPIRISIFHDRMEIENPGLLPFGLTLEDIPRGVSKLRNRVVGRVFHELGLVENWGSGAQRMIAACRDSGLQAPSWEEIGGRLRVTFRFDAVGAATTDEMDGAILALLAESRGLRTRDIAASIGLSPRATRTRLAKLVERGLVRELGRGPTDPGRLYVKTIQG